MKIKNTDFTSGKLLSLIITYTIPLVLSGLIQVFFNAADMAVLGAFDKSPDSSAVGAIGATGAISALLINSMINMSMGTNVLLARTVGAKDDERSQRIVGSSLLLAVTLGVIMIGVGTLSAPWFLKNHKLPRQFLQRSFDLPLHIYSGIPRYTDIQLRLGNNQSFGR